ncbi:MAG: PIN domain-containing protein [Acidobacteriota bacterium]|nr:PIN domain-containing protein [Acidobacteriota bacterium]
MSVEDFLDSNVFVYLFDETDPRKRQLAERLVKRALEHQTGCISFQVVQETLNVMTRKLKVPPETAHSGKTDCPFLRLPFSTFRKLARIARLFPVPPSPPEYQTVPIFPPRIAISTSTVYTATV